MARILKELITNQFEAVLCTLHLCIENCPVSHWNERVANLRFCQLSFHTLFFTDLYLGRNATELKEQDFHLRNQDYFRDYEELQDKPQTLLSDKQETIEYLFHCRAKAKRVVESETVATLEGGSGFERRNCSRAELHVYNMRHVQHHAAQLSLRLRMDLGIDIPWISSGWRETRI